MSVQNTTIYFLYIKIVYSQGDMFRPSLGHPQALKENRFFNKNPLWDPKCSQNVIGTHVFVNIYTTSSSSSSSSIGTATLVGYGLHNYL